MNVWLESTEVDDLGGKAGQRWIDRGEDGATISAGNEELGYGGHDESVGLGLDLAQSPVEVAECGAVDDLSGLHDVP